MELFRIIKSDAKRAMRFCGGRTVAALFALALAFLAVNLAESIFILCNFGLGVLYDYSVFSVDDPMMLFVTAGSSVLWILLVPAIIIGYIKLHLSFAEGNDESVLMVFERFSSFRKYFGSVFFAIGFGLRYLFAFAAAVLPGGALFWFAENFIPEGNRTAELLNISAFGLATTIMVLCIALAIIFVQRWNLAVYYYAAGNGIRKSFSLSAKAAKGLHTRILSFKFSFIGWGILSLFILPLIWTVPYYEMANAIFAKYLMERYERSLAEVPEINSEETD